MIQMEATVFVNKKVSLDFGTVLKCAHPHRYKDESGDWKTASTTYIDVLVRNEKKGDFADLLATEEGARVTLTGHGKPLSYTNADGKTLVGLQIEPHEFEVMSAGKAEEEAPF